MRAISCMSFIPLLRIQLTSPRSQAATAHSFHTPRDLALQAVTSVPARSIGMHHRVGYAKPGYDADLVVWDSHPLLNGATPLQVYIDGRATLDPEVVKDSLSPMASFGTTSEPKMRTVLEKSAKQEICKKFEEGKTVITGITTSYLKETSGTSLAAGNLTLVIEKGKIACFGSTEECITHSSGGTIISLENGHILPGLTATSTTLGMLEISSEGSTGDGFMDKKLSPLDPENVVYAKYGVHLDGKLFDRARIGGVTRAISVPMQSDDGDGAGFVDGVAVGVKTSGKDTLLDGGVWKEEVYLQFTLGQASKGALSPFPLVVLLLPQGMAPNKRRCCIDHFIGGRHLEENLEYQRWERYYLRTCSKRQYSAGCPS